MPIFIQQKSPLQVVQKEMQRAKYQGQEQNTLIDTCDRDGRVGSIPVIADPAVVPGTFPAVEVEIQDDAIAIRAAQS